MAETRGGVGSADWQTTIGDWDGLRPTAFAARRAGPATIGSSGWAPGPKMTGPTRMLRWVPSRTLGREPQQLCRVVAVARLW